MVMPSWLPTDEARAAAAWSRIQEKPSSVVIVRGTSTTLAAQTVRLEYSGNQPAEPSGGAGMSSKQTVILFGIRGHETEADTNVQRGDRFAVSGVQYRVVAMVQTIGEVQATCEAMA